MPTSAPRLRPGFRDGASQPNPLTPAAYALAYLLAPLFVGLRRLFRIQGATEALDPGVQRDLRNGVEWIKPVESDALSQRLQ